MYYIRFMLLESTNLNLLRRDYVSMSYRKYMPVNFRETTILFEFAFPVRTCELWMEHYNQVNKKMLLWKTPTEQDG